MPEIIKTTDIDLEHFLNFLRKEIEEKREMSALSGDFHDGGASELKKQIDIFIAGLQKLIPYQWNQYIKKYKKETDPDYQEYLRLKKKFE